MTITEPAPNATFAITTLPLWPSIVFKTDARGPHTWDWTIAWDVFSVGGTEMTASGIWNAAAVIGNRGGRLTVKVTAGGVSATITVSIRAVNPSVTEVTSYLNSRPNSDGFGAIVAHETNTVHFKNSAPLKSGDSGFGICQLTNPRPTFEQVWNWKLNIDAGLALFAQKRAAAMAFLGQDGRAFTNDQLRRETVCRWNGGAYHRWDDQARHWIRNPDILCDRQTRNIGWDMTNAANAGKTEADLRTRDHPYAVPRPAGARYNFFGLCYADRVLG